MQSLLPILFLSCITHLSISSLLQLIHSSHRKKDLYRRQSKGRRCCLGEEFIQFFVALAVFPRMILKNRLNSSFFPNHQIILLLKIVLSKTLAWQGIEWILTPKQKRRSLPFLLSLSFFYAFSCYPPHIPPPSPLPPPPPWIVIPPASRPLLSSLLLNNYFSPPCVKEVVVFFLPPRLRRRY